MPVGLLHLSCPAHDRCYAKVSMCLMFAEDIYMHYPGIVDLVPMNMTVNISYKSRVYFFRNRENSDKTHMKQGKNTDGPESV